MDEQGNKCVNRENEELRLKTRTPAGADAMESMPDRHMTNSYKKHTALMGEINHYLHVY